MRYFILFHIFPYVLCSRYRVASCIQQARRIKRSSRVLSPTQPCCSCCAALLLREAQSSYCWQRRDAIWLASTWADSAAAFAPEPLALLCSEPRLERSRCPPSSSADGDASPEPFLPPLSTFRLPPPLHSCVLFPRPLPTVLY